MTRRFGREATTYLAEPLLAGIHAGDVDRLSLGALFPRFADAEQKHGSLIRAFRRRRRRPRRLARSSRCPAVWARWSARSSARCRPAPFIPNTVVTRTGRNPGGQGFRVETGAGPAHECRALVLSTPAYVTASLLRESRCRACPALCRDPLLVDRDRGAGVSARGRRASIERIGVRRAADRRKRYSRRDVALVQVAAPGAGRKGAAADVSRGLARSRGARAVGQRTRGAIALRHPAGAWDSRRAVVCSRLSIRPRERAARSGSSRSAGGHRSDAGRASRTVSDRQRVPRRRAFPIASPTPARRQSKSPTGSRSKAPPQRSRRTNGGHSENILTDTMVAVCLRSFPCPPW